jgi:hypothetical protein
MIAVPVAGEEITSERIKTSERLSRLENYLYHELLNRVISLGV